MTNDPESYRAYDLIAEHFPPSDDDVNEVVVIRSTSLDVSDPEFRSKVEAIVSAIEATGAVQPVRSFYSTSDPTLVAASGRTTIVPLGFRGDGEDAIGEVIEIVDAAEADGFETAITGEFTADEDFSTLSEEDLQKGELQFGLPVALLVLLLVFGAVVAGLLPVVVALVSIVVALGLTALVGQAFDLSVFVVNMISGMGLALGIDYSLFVVSRFREERRLGSEKLDAIATVGSTACRAVLFSGSAFVLAMVGMVLVPDTILRSLAARRAARRRRHRGRRAHVAPGGALPARRPGERAPRALARTADRGERGRRGQGLVADRRSRDARARARGSGLDRPSPARDGSGARVSRPA